MSSDLDSGLTTANGTAPLETSAQTDSLAVWQKRLKLMQVLAIIWMLSSQWMMVALQKAHSEVLVRAAWSSFALIVALSILLLSSKARTQTRTLLCFALELGALFVASLYGVAPGFELLWLASLARAGLAVTWKQVLVLAAQCLIAYWFIVASNPMLIVQSTDLSIKDATLLTVLFGRDFWGFFVGLALALVLTRALRSEREFRSEADELSRRIETLSRELERNRIADEINTNVDHILVALMLQMEYADQVRHQSSDAALEALGEARELAGKSLSEVRRALSLMRDFESLPERSG